MSLPQELQNPNTWRTCHAWVSGVQVSKIGSPHFILLQFSDAHCLQGTAFDDFNDFRKRIEGAGVAAMEMVAMEMKAVWTASPCLIYG